MSEATLEVILPHPLETTALNRYIPLIASVVLDMEVLEELPPILAQDTPLLVVYCHWIDGAGVPLTATEKVAVLPAHTVTLDGWVVMAGKLLTVNAAA